MSPKNRSMLGVTLLEIMLVLAIAGMIIVMSIRYYQSASSSGQANTALQLVQGIIAAEETVLQSSGAYVDGSNTALTGLLPSNGTVLPWGGNATITGGANSFSIKIDNIPEKVCPLFNPKVITNTRIKAAGNCSTTGVSSITYTYQ